MIGKESDTSRAGLPAKSVYEIIVKFPADEMFLARTFG